VRPAALPTGHDKADCRSVMATPALVRLPIHALSSRCPSRRYVAGPWFEPVRIVSGAQSLVATTAQRQPVRLASPQAEGQVVHRERRWRAPMRQINRSQPADLTQALMMSGETHWGRMTLQGAEPRRLGRRGHWTTLRRTHSSMAIAHASAKGSTADGRHDCRCAAPSWAHHTAGRQRSSAQHGDMLHCTCKRRW